MKLKGAASLVALAAAIAAQADTFSVNAVSASGDISFTPTATYWDPSTNQLTPNFNIGIAGANNTASVTVISDGNAAPGWWFAGESSMTFAGSVQWSGTPDPNEKVRITSTITDLDNNHVYQMISSLDSAGSHWATNLNFLAPTQHVKWSDKIDLITGNTGTIAQWVSTNHTMNMSQVPEPSSFATLVVLAGIFVGRKLKR